MSEFEDILNELNSYPDELKYSEDRWEKALLGIEAYERNKRRRYAIFAAILLPLAIAASLFFLDSEESISSSELTDQQQIPAIQERDVLREDQSKHLGEKQDGIAIKSGDGTTHLKDGFEDNSVDIHIFESQVQQVSESTKTHVRELVAQLQEDTPTENTTLAQLSNNDVVHESAQLELLIEKEEESLSEEKTRPFERIVDIGDKMSLLGTDLTDYKVVRALENVELLEFQKPFSLPRRFLDLQLGYSLWQDYGTGSSVQSDDFGLAIKYNSFLSESIRWSAGFRYLRVSDTPVRPSSDVTSYGYGQEMLRTTVGTERLDYFGIPLSVTYQVKPRLEASLGIGVDYLLQIRNTVTRHRLTGLSDEILLNEESAKGIVEGYSELIFNTEVGVDYWIFDRWSAGISYQQGLSDISHDGSEGGSGHHANSMVSLRINKLIR